MSFPTRASRRARAGFTLADVMVSLAVLVVIGGIAFIVLNTGLILFAKNASLNTVHDSARKALDQIAFDIYQTSGITSEIIQLTQVTVVAGTDPKVGPIQSLTYTYNAGDWDAVANSPDLSKSTTSPVWPVPNTYYAVTTSSTGKVYPLGGITHLDKRRLGLLQPEQGLEPRAHRIPEHQRLHPQAAHHAVSLSGLPPQQRRLRFQVPLPRHDRP